MEKKKVVLIYSGGLDSTVLYAQLLKMNYDVFALNFQYGSKHNRAELIRAYRIEEIFNGGVSKHQLKVVELPLDRLFVSSLLQSGEDIPEGHYAAENMRSTVVPFRNGIMLSIAAGYAESIGADTIYLASHAGDHYIYPDCRPEFNDAMNDAIMQGTGGKVDLLAPFAQMSKANIVSLGDSLDVPLYLTWSCYKGGTTHCGKCGSCNERREAFSLAGVVDNTEYLTDAEKRA